MVEERRRLLQASSKEIALMQAKLVGRLVEEPVRKARVEELQGKTQNSEPVRAQGARDALMLSRETKKLETLILELNEENLRMADAHREQRTTVSEKQNKLRILGKRERELVKHVEALAEKLTQASKALETGQHKDFRALPGISM